MTVIVWIVESSWPACVQAAARYRAPDTEIVLLHVTDGEVAEVVHGAYAGLLGRGHPDRDPGARVEELATSAGHRLLQLAAAALGRPCRLIERRGPVATEVVEAAAGAELLVVGRDGRHSIDHATRHIIEHTACPVLVVGP